MECLVSDALGDLGTYVLPSELYSFRPPQPEILSYRMSQNVSLSFQNLYQFLPQSFYLQFRIDQNCERKQGQKYCAGERLQFSGFDVQVFLGTTTHLDNN